MTGDEAARTAERVHETAYWCRQSMVPSIATMTAGAWTGGQAGALLADLHAEQRAVLAALHAAVTSVDGAVVDARAADRKEAERLEQERLADEDGG